MTASVTFYDEAPEQRDRRIFVLAEAAWERGRKLLVHCESAARARELDETLWTLRQESFVPHEHVPPGDRPRDPEARVVLVDGEHDPIGAEVLVQDGPTSPDFAGRYGWVIDFVDHRDAERLQASRERFRAWRDRGLRPGYQRGGP